MNLKTADGAIFKSRALGARSASWPTIAVIVLALTAGSTGAGYQARTNAVEWIRALSAASYRVAASAGDRLHRIDTAHADADVTDPPYLVERVRGREIERIKDSDRHLIALVVATLLLALAVLERFDALVAASSVEATSASKPISNQIFDPPAIGHPTRPRSRVECLGAQNENEIIARYADRPATRSVTAVLKHSIN
jgi:hypothetical protein